MTTRNAGLRDQRIQLQRRAAGVDALGQPDGAWVTYATVWAKARPARGREYVAAAQVQSELPTVFEIDYRTNVNEKTDRVLWRGRAFDLVAPPFDEFGAKTGLQLVCVSGVRDGQ